MASKAARGTKRTCQNDDCGARFYDLNRDPIVCPVCQTAYTLVMSAAAIAAEEKAAAAAARIKAKKPEVLQPEGEIAPEGAEELVDIEVAEEPVAAEADETFLEEEEEEGGDVSGILGGPVAEGEEEV